MTTELNRRRNAKTVSKIRAGWLDLLSREVSRPPVW